jgi:hypothetical protein
LGAALIRVLQKKGVLHGPYPDLASYGIMKPLGDITDGSFRGLSWAPKEAFYSLSKYYGELK